MKDDKDLMSSLDQEPWLTLSVWGDRCADSGDTTREAVLRWMVQHKRAPLRKYLRSIYEGRTKEAWEWRWLFKGSQGRKGTFYITQHTLWRHGTTGTSRVRKTFKSASEAYRYAVDHLSENLELLK